MYCKSQTRIVNCFKLKIKHCQNVQCLIAQMFELWLFLVYRKKNWTTALTIYDADPNLGNFNFTQEPNDL